MWLCVLSHGGHGAIPFFLILWRVSERQWRGGTWSEAAPLFHGMVPEGHCVTGVQPAPGGLPPPLRLTASGAAKACSRPPAPVLWSWVCDGRLSLQQNTPCQGTRGL